MNNYNDGVIYFYKRNNITNSFKAQRNTTSKDDLEYVSKYYFKEETKRQQDVAFADALGRELSYKVSFPYTNELDSSYVAIIDNYLYSIFHLDPDKGKDKTYVYLEGMRKIERQNI